MLHIKGNWEDYKTKIKKYIPKLTATKLVRALLRENQFRELLRTLGRLTTGKKLTILADNKETTMEILD